MQILFWAFTFYDNLIGKLPIEAQFLVSLAILILLIFSVIGLAKHGHWIFLVLFVVFFPGGWPALKHIGQIIWLICKFLWVRIITNLPFQL